MVPLIIIVQIGRVSDMGSDKSVIIVVDQYVHNATVYYGGEFKRYDVMLTDAMREELSKSFEPFNH